MIRDLLTGLRDIKLLVFACVSLVAVASTGLVVVDRKIKAADAAGYARAVNNARFDSALVAMVDSARSRGAARVDTVRDTVRVRVERVRDVIVRVPDSVRVAVPVVDTLVIESRALVASVDSLAAALDAERAANALALSVVRNAVQASRLETARYAAQVLALEKRPRWTTLVLTDVVAFGVGYGVATVRR